MRKYMEKILKEKIIKILEEVKWEKIEGNASKIASTCPNVYNRFPALKSCCGACPTCECHDELEKYADKIYEAIQSN